MSDAILDQIREIIQRDVNNRGLARDPKDNLFTRCRDDFANACRSIAETPQPSVAVVTGFFIPHAQPPCGETDGPLGGIFLARALTSIEMNVALVTDSFCRQALETGLQACDLETTVSILVLPAEASSFPRSAWERKPGRSAARPARGQDATQSVANVRSHEERGNEREMGTTHLLALERVGPGSDGRCHNMHGRDVSDEMCPAHLLFDDIARQSPPFCTIGIGDGGNEIGMGKIPADVIACNIPNGERIACRVPTDHLIVAGVSNWGAYALAAGVAVLRGQRLPASLFDVERERELLQIMVEQGPLVDGVTAKQTVSVDGLAFDDYAEPLRRIGELLEKERWLT
ncbi:MAG TPA: DUF4392 domain-containing protein [Gemmataceae bacterium]|nr:DUF4392 domain-containing protein [Gemmataceae bacterium]